MVCFCCIYFARHTNVYSSLLLRFVSGLISFELFAMLIADRQRRGDMPHFDQEEIMPSTNVGGPDTLYTTKWFSNAHVQVTPSLTIDGWRAMLSGGGKGS